MSNVWPKLIEKGFTGCVRRGRWLGRIPLLPPFADALVQAAVAVTDPGRLRAMRAVEAEVAKWPEVICGVHRFGGVEFRRARREFGHLHGCGLVDVRPGIDVARRWVAEGAALPHYVLGESTWVSFWIRQELDVPQASLLLRLAWNMSAD